MKTIMTITQNNWNAAKRAVWFWVSKILFNHI